LKITVINPKNNENNNCFIIKLLNELDSRKNYYFKICSNNNRIYHYPHLIISVTNERAIVLQMTAIKYDKATNHSYFSNKQIEEEDYQGFTVDLTTKEEMKCNSVVLLRYVTIVAQQDRYRIVGELTNLEKLILIN